MRLYFVRSNRERVPLGQVYNNHETGIIIKQFMDEHNFKSYYTRMWYEEKDKELWFDVGSHTEFFVVTQVEPNSEYYKSFLKERNF